MEPSTLFCPKCGKAMTVADDTFVCVPGDMELSRHLRDLLTEVFVARSRSGREVPLNWGGSWFCPGCGVQATTDKEHVRCHKCGEYLDEFLYQFIEFHPHRDHGGWR